MRYIMKILIFKIKKMTEIEIGNIVNNQWAENVGLQHLNCNLFAPLYLIATK